MDVSSLLFLNPKHFKDRDCTDETFPTHVLPAEPRSESFPLQQVLHLNHLKLPEVLLHVCFMCAQRALAQPLPRAWGHQQQEGAKLTEAKFYSVTKHRKIIQTQPEETLYPVTRALIA